MKIKTQYVLLSIIPLLASCASERVALAPVGPNPFVATRASAGPGYLRVFSERERITEGSYEGANPSFYQHTDYRIYDAQGRLVKHVGNTVGHYASSPRLVSLPPGNYIVDAQAKDYLSAKVPVLIESGRTTSVHLDDRWTPPAGTPKAEVVIEPNGNPAGWQAGASKQHA